MLDYADAKLFRQVERVELKWRKIDSQERIIILTYFLW